MTSPAIGSYRGLGAAALETLRDHGVDPDDWIARHYTDGQWHGDTCGCPDDRCIGNHHDEADYCDCLPSLLYTGNQT